MPQCKESHTHQNSNGMFFCILEDNHLTRHCCGDGHTWGAQIIEGVNPNDGGARWHWDGNKERPTLTPSILDKGDCCGWHGWLRNGEWVSA